MTYDFRRGRQMIIHDPRLNNPHTTPPTALTPPDPGPDGNSWTVSLTDTADHIVGWAAVYAAGDGGKKKADAIHFMGHGHPGGIDVGKDGFGWGNVEVWKKLNGKVRGAIIFFSCQVGGEQQYHGLQYQLTFGNVVCEFAQCKVVCCKVNQVYSWNSSNVIDFGDFEDVVYLYTPGAGARLLNFDKNHTVDLEEIVFG